MPLSDKPSLAAGLAEMESCRSGLSLLMVTIEECESCEALRHDAAALVEALRIDQACICTLAVDDDGELAPARKLRITDVPSVYLFNDGVIKGGWSGYDHNFPQDVRVSNLCAKISAKLVSH
ncbi:MAG: hypothetical protein HEQ22_08485 [Sphingopyxis sp.]|uniref:hypothetical protein n=1 Tax=Sphingopyxis sp. TaxID=1908224 RepID=UPI003D810455